MCVCVCVCVCLCVCVFVFVVHVVCGVSVTHIDYFQAFMLCVVMLVNYPQANRGLCTKLVGQNGDEGADTGAWEKFFRTLEKFYWT